MKSNASIGQGNLMPAAGRRSSFELALEGFRTWDALERKSGADQVGTLNRWNKDEQTP